MTKELISKEKTVVIKCFGSGTNAGNPYQSAYSKYLGNRM